MTPFQKITRLHRTADGSLVPVAEEYVDHDGTIVYSDLHTYPADLEPGPATSPARPGPVAACLAAFAAAVSGASLGLTVAGLLL